MRNLLLLSNSTNYGEAYLGWAMAEIELFLQNKNISEALFVPYAGVSVEFDAYEAKVASSFKPIGVKITSIHRVEDPIKAVKEAECIIVGGGNTFHLVHHMHQYKIMSAIRNRALEGMPFIGWSAGSNIASPTLRTTNDMPIIMPESFDCLNLVPFQINPHYLDQNEVIDNMIKHGGETREDRINEFLAINQYDTVVGLREACALRIDANMITLRGGKSLRVFKFNQEPKEFKNSDDIQFLLK
ncbi:MAG: dipeptidase PepE [Bacteroidota bacterium]